MYVTVTILILVVCALLILIVLVQNSKGGGLASTFASSNQIMGVRKTTDFLEKATWTLAGALFVLCLVAAAFIPRQGENSGSALERKLQNESNAPVQTIPTFPGSSDAQQTTEIPLGGGAENNE